MPRVSREEKKRSKEQVLMSIKRHHGLREAELETLLHIQRRTLNNYLNELEREGKIYKDRLNWFIDPNAGNWLRRFELAADEAFSLYLAARTFVKQTDKQNKIALSALSRLAEVLKTDLPINNQIFEAAQELRTREKQSSYEDHFTKLIRAYLRRNPVTIEYRSAQGAEFKTTFHIYLVEPSAIGYTLYFIGYSQHVDAVRAYKIERITAVTVHHNSHYEIPEKYRTPAFLKNAWSIISGDSLERIVLRFSKRVKARVLETNWHPAQDYDDKQPDGSLLWWVDVASTIDMLPWIRGWGSDVEVLEPDHLRKRLRRTAQRLAKKYDVASKAKMLLHLPYAKTNPDDKNEIHLLLYHLIDVGQVTAVLWAEVLTEPIRTHIANLLQLNVDEAGRLLCFLASLHDIGKAGPAYQNKYAPKWLKKELITAGLVLQDLDRYSEKTQNPQTPHATVSMWFLRDYLPKAFQIKKPDEKRFFHQIATALGGHHGAWPPPRAERNIDDRRYPNWEALRQDLAWELDAVFRPPKKITAPEGEERNIFLAWFSGLVSVADWLGSRNKECFGFEERPLSTRHYAAQARQKARDALADLGWLGWQPSGDLQSFAQTFAYLNFAGERPLQAEVIAAAKACGWPTLLILEAVTGIGKTETAVYIADHWLQTHHGRGLYIAMPTQATSEQMFSRIKAYLRHRYPDDLVNTHLVHGQASWSDRQKEIELQRVGDDKKATGVAAMSWFKPRKRTLLAPFGVGTVDQTLLSILQTRHFFVRLFGLGHKIIIFDEVHAYDTFMSTLFHRLLAWLRAMNCSVIILSATLPAKTKQALVEAYSGQSWALPPPAYPALTLAEPNETPRQLGLTPPEAYTVEIDTDSVTRAAASIVAFLRDALAKGGCAAVICNTVGRAQAIYHALQAANLELPGDDLILFHARFPPIWRRDIEEKVLRKFGKPDENGRSPHRPAQAIVVATQVIEQSLDLDFDIMITDLAPIDLVLQRAGRLHRHKRGARSQPHRLLITQPQQGADEQLDFGNDAYIYEPYILHRSWQVLQRDCITIPADTTDLIEAVYGAEPDEALRSAYEKMLDNQRKAEAKAGGQLILQPNNRRLLRQSIRQLEEDDPDVHHTFRAQTRDIAPSVTVICLQQEDDALFITDGEKRQTVYLDNEPHYSLVKLLLQHSITLHRRDLVNALLAQSPPAGWQSEASLRHCRAVCFVNGRSAIANTNLTLQLSREYGLEILNEEAL